MPRALRNRGHWCHIDAHALPVTGQRVVCAGQGVPGGTRTPIGCLEGGLIPWRERPRSSSRTIFICSRLTVVGLDDLLDRARNTGHGRGTAPLGVSG